MSGKTEDHKTVSQRFGAAGLTDTRFVEVQEGEKACFDHDTRYDSPSAVPGKNYGVYADRDDPLVVIDVDDYGETDEETQTGLKALFELPPTLEVSSPHGGTHKFYAVKTDGEAAVAEVLADKLGVKNPTPTWGEVQVENKYVVGAGSQLDGCDKGWCEECAEADSGWYEVDSDTAIATVDDETLVRVLKADPDVGGGNISTTEGKTQVSPPTGGGKSRERTDGFDAEVVNDALSEINPDVDYNTWRNIAYGLRSEFSHSRAMSLFKDWSRNGRKWDDEAEEQAESILNDASPAGGCSLGTVIYHAKENGWSPPASATWADEDLAETVEDEVEDTTDLNGADVWEIWSEERSTGRLDDTSVIPTLALRYIAERESLYNFDRLDENDLEELPPKAHNRALWWVKNEWAEEHLDLNDDGDATARSYKPRDTAVYTWEDVRYIYEDSKERGRKAARALLSERNEFMTVAGSETLHLYDEATGVFTEKTGPIRAEIYEELGEHWSTHELNEIVAGLRQSNVVEPRHLDAGHREEAFLCLENGVLDLYDRELHDHSPEYHFTARVPVKYAPEAETDTYEKFVADLVGREADKNALFEMVGHALIPDANTRYKKFLMLTGDADNGKTMFYSGVKTLLNGPDGQESNTAGVKLAKLAQNRFSIHSMYGTLANIAGEIDGKKIRNTANLKDITGGDEVEIEPKGQDSFFDTLGTTLMFAANDPPILGERDKKAIASRIVPVELPYTFVEDPDPDVALEKQRIPERELKTDLEDPEALSGLLNLALDGLERLEANGGDVSLPEPPEERLEKYERSADPMREFGTVALENDPDEYLVKADITSMYKEFASRRGYEVGSNIGPVLHGVLRGVEAINYTDSKPRHPDYDDTTVPLKGWSERKEVVDRVTLTEEGMELAEAAGLVIDEEKQTGADDGGTQKALAARGPQYGADITATVETVNDGEYSREAQGRLAGEHTYIGFVVPGGNDIELTAYQNDRVRLRGVTLRTDDDGLLEAVIDDAVKVERVGPDEKTGQAPQASLDSTAAADGGAEKGTRPDDAEGTRANAQDLAKVLSSEGARSPDNALTAPEVASKALDLDLSPDEVSHALEYGATKMQDPLFLRNPDEDGEDGYWLN